MGNAEYMGSLDTPAELSQQTQFSPKRRPQFSTKTKWVQKSSSFFSLSSLLPLHSPFSLDLLQKDVALTETALDSGEPLARAEDPISSSSSQLVAGRGHTLCLGGVTWCRTLDVTLEISLGKEPVQRWFALRQLFIKPRLLVWPELSVWPLREAAKEN